MNIKVIYHSSTGNTEKLARAIAGALNIQAERLGKGPVSFSEPIDLLFLGDGEYFGKASKKMRAFIKGLDPKTVRRTAVFATYGGQPKIGAAIIKLLKNKGLKVAGEPFTCKGRAWIFLNRSHPDETELANVRKFAIKTVAKANK